MLHTVNKSPFQNSSLEDCLRVAQKGDVILLLEDGVYAASAGTAKSSLIEKVVKQNAVYAIEADLKARGLGNLIKDVGIASYGDFVDLVEKHTAHAWL
ncbi:MAG: sulfurtransferase complex subunit TusB [Sulfuricaulis sp.]|uniref:sulfurtransferase complex subunit TusB n=1 Tax=Sulfuricaulis sp. TaxID=2003553 RepID=UPI0025E09CBE|nr:sulfurtransferase complex subunit TusB [Sulfuricaulis sp.]MCR4347198.1 sulfurtransferase complex subunit TusB [Sulfuricaulis sp.]